MGSIPVCLLMCSGQRRTSCKGLAEMHLPIGQNRSSEFLRIDVSEGPIDFVVQGPPRRRSAEDHRSPHPSPCGFVAVSWPRPGPSGPRHGLLSFLGGPSAFFKMCCWALGALGGPYGALGDLQAGCILSGLPFGVEEDVKGKPSSSKATPKKRKGGSIGSSVSTAATEGASPASAGS